MVVKRTAASGGGRSLAVAVIAGWVACAAPAWADDGSLTLGQAVMRALEAGASAQIARLETHRAEHEHAQVRGAYLPQVGVTSEAGWSNRMNDTFYGLASDGQTLQKYSLATIAPDRAWLQLYISQTLFDLKQWREIEREEVEIKLARIAETRARDDVALEVTRRYAHLLELQERAGAAEEQMIDAEWLSEQSDHLLEAGRALELDNSMVQLHREQADLERRARAADMRTARTELWIALGEHEPHSIPISLDEDSLPVMNPRDAELSLAEQVAASPEVRILDLQRRVRDAEVSAAKAGRWPTLKFVSGYANYGPKRFDAYKDEIWVGVDLEIPIFDGLQSSNAIKGAERNAEIARLRHRSELEKKRVHVREIVQQLQTSSERLSLAERRVETAREQKRLADLNLQAERGALGSSLAARERLARLTGEAIDARFSQLDLWAELQRELGRLADTLVGPQLAQAP